MTARLRGCARRIGRTFTLRHRRCPPAILAAGDTSPPPAQVAEFEAWAKTATVIEPDSIESRLPSGAEAYGAFPSREELLELKWFAEQTQSAVASYAGETFAGNTEYEWCWEFGPSERVLVHVEHSEVVTESPRSWIGRKPVVGQRRYFHRVHELTATGDHVVPDPDANVLEMMLRSLGVPTRGGYFEPHLRGFDWKKYRVAPST